MPGPDGAGVDVPDVAPSHGMIGASYAMHALRRTIIKLASFDEPVLVTGETGVGKELVARALHAASPHRSGPFVAVNAGAIPGTLIASELFGHVRGAFTGACSTHRGLFEQAHRGTLHLDEVGELALDLQAWLLRVLETGEVHPLGAERTRKVDVRVIASTNRDLAAAVQERRFRADLYWRLAVLTVDVPPLRDRREDIAALAQHFLHDRELEPEALQALTLHTWPGNVRELRSVLARAAAHSTHRRLSALDVVHAIGRPFAPRVACTMYDAVIAADGNVSEAARRLGLARSTVRDRLQRAADAASRRGGST